MSHFEEIPEQPEHVAARPIAWTLGITVLVIITCGVVVWTLDAFHLRGGGRTNIEELRLVPPAEPFSTLTNLETRRIEERADLDRWSWANRPQGLVNLPIDLAIDRYLEQGGPR